MRVGGLESGLLGWAPLELWWGSSVGQRVGAPLELRRGAPLVQHWGPPLEMGMVCELWLGPPLEMGQV